jgi:hypothetical protein
MVNERCLLVSYHQHHIIFQSPRINFPRSSKMCVSRAKRGKTAEVGQTYDLSTCTSYIICVPTYNMTVC